MTDWGSLPLLPLGCILKHLSMKDALAATSTCKHWRNGVMLYSSKARKDTLKLNIKHLAKCEFLVRFFKRNVRRLYIFIDCNEPEIEKFMKVVFVHFFDIVRLQELMFIGPMYMQQSNHVPFIKLKRITIESLIYKNSETLLKLGFLGCHLQTSCERENERFSHSAIEEHSRMLDFPFLPCLSDSVLCRANERLMPYLSLLHIIVDYEQINTAALMTLSHLGNLVYLSINLTNRKISEDLAPIDWELVDELYSEPLLICVNIIGVPIRRFDDIMEKVLVPGMKVVSLKVMFCKSLYTPLIAHASRVYQETLMEMVWVDCPYDSADPYHRVVRPYRSEMQPTSPHPLDGSDGYAHVNPFVLMCWQCNQLRRLVIHGYWVWQYDVTGFVRLRQDLAHLEISAVYDRQDRFHNMVSLSEEGTMRVLCGDRPLSPDPDHLQEVSELLEYPWRPTPWSQLHPALRSRASRLQRAQYLAAETRAVLNNRAREDNC